MEILKTDTFDKWFVRVKDKKAKAIIQVHLNRLFENNFGILRSVGKCVYEKKIDYGPGYRLYFMNKNKEIVILLCGGDKSTQHIDIEKAKKIAQEIKKEMK